MTPKATALLVKGVIIFCDLTTISVRTHLPRLTVNSIVTLHRIIRMVSIKTKISQSGD